MVTKFILIFKKGNKRPLGAIPVKKGVSVSKIKRTVPKQLRSGFRARIVSKEMLKKLILRLAPRTRKTFKRRSRSFKKRKK